MSMPSWAASPGPGFTEKSHSNIDVVWERDGEHLYQFGPDEYHTHTELAAVIPDGFEVAAVHRQRPGRPVIAAVAVGGLVVGAGLVELVAHVVH